MLKFDRRQLLAAPLLLAVPPAQPPAQAGVRLIRIRGTGPTPGIALGDDLEDARIAGDVRRRYVERLRYLASQRAKGHKVEIDHELAIYGELLGVQHVFGGPAGWLPS